MSLYERFTVDNEHYSGYLSLLCRVFNNPNQVIFSLEDKGGNGKDYDRFSPDKSGIRAKTSSCFATINEQVQAISVNAAK